MVANNRMLPSEKRTAFALALVFFLRMLGLFMLLPVLSLYADRLVGSTPLLIGIALGIYGLTQACFQIPMGRLSDHFGRKPVATMGLVIFSIGGLVAAASGHIAAVVGGRALQGAGAISGATLALAADLTREEQRTKVMAIIGISIGISFSAAFVIGPIIDAAVGLSGLFRVSAGFGICAIIILWVVVPAEVPATRDTTPTAQVPVSTVKLTGLYIGIFILHAILAASFIAIPIVFVDELHISVDRHFTIYIPVLITSLLAVAPMIIRSHRQEHTDALTFIAIACIAIGEIALWRYHESLIIVALALVLFFTGFNYLEASLPSAVSKASSRENRGQALGGYSTAQFLGMFAGGLCGGGLAGQMGYPTVFALCAAGACLWGAYVLYTTKSQ